MIERLGPYRLIREIGRGGMGTVYLAERDGDYTQRVAIKTVRAAAAAGALRRFDEERRLLATLHHPGIARLLGSGTTPEGLPYLVLELVEGTPITRYAAGHALTPRQRVELLLRVCDAVSCAHRALILHRDLKPSNILVTPDGTPKLVDFGIATLAGADSREPGYLTREYASPEQAAGTGIALTTATDVYSLGVVLFELLTGRRPSNPETAAPDDPRGDLHTILRCALHPEPGSRYASVDRMADDLRRWLAGRPIAARPATWHYVTRRFLVRNRTGVAAALAFAVTVAGFGLALGWSAARARHERDAAERVTSMLVDIFSGSDPRAPNGEAIAAQTLLDRGTDAIRRDLGDQPDVQARLLDAMGAIYGGLGLSGGTRSVAHEAPVAWNGAGLADAPPAARALGQLAASLRERGRLGAAESVARRALEMNRRLFGLRNPQTGDALNTLASIVYERGRRDEAERLFLEVTETFRDSLGPRHPMVATGLQNLAMIRRDRGDTADAERLLREAIAIRRWILGQTALDNETLLADIVTRAGRPDEAEALLRDAVAVMERTGHPRVDVPLGRLADLVRSRGREVEADAIMARARAAAAERAEGTR